MNSRAFKESQDRKIEMKRMEIKKKEARKEETGNFRKKKKNC